MTITYLYLVMAIWTIVGLAVFFTCVEFDDVRETIIANKKLFFAGGPIIWLLALSLYITIKVEDWNN